MTENASYTKEYFDILDSFEGDIAGRRACREYMDNSTAIVHHRHVASSFIPRLFDKTSYDTFKTIAETAHTILCKVMSEYLENPAYRDIFDYDERLKELILIPRRYDALLPFARVDVFLNEDTLECGFCEINGDGSAGMNENREITHSIETSRTFTEFAKRHHVEGCELFRSWVAEFIRIYDTFENKRENPRFAVCDYLENAVVDEFKVFSTYFADAGYECVVEDVRKLKYDGTELTDSSGRRIDAIWRRSVTNDVMDNWDESQNLISAVRDGAVALIGSFAGHIVHDKQIFEALYHPLTKALLTPEENEFVAAHIPMTTFLDSEHVDLEQIRTHKDDWIIKPTDAYGAQDVYAGCFSTQKEWDDLLVAFADRAAGEPFLVQTYITPFKTDTLPPDLDIANLSDDQIESKPVPYNNLNGLYLYNGTFQGIFSRLGPYPTISKPMKGITSATIWVDCE